MRRRAIALLVLTAFGCELERADTGRESDPIARPERDQPADPEDMGPEEAAAAAARWLAIPPPADRATFDPAAFEWRLIPGMERLAREGAAHATIAAREQGGGTACSGGMCSTALDARVLRGDLPSERVGYFAGLGRSDPLPCEEGSEPGLFRNWRIVEIAPRSSAEGPLECGIGIGSGDAHEAWVILRVGASR